MKTLIAAAALSLVAVSPASASVVVYTFAPHSYHTATGDKSLAVTGSFQFDTNSGLVSAVDYNNQDDNVHYTFGGERNTGDPTSVYFSPVQSTNFFTTPRYDVFQLGSTLANGGTVLIVSGTRPFVNVVAGGSLTAAAAVPEPATWAMMLMGFGIVGAGLRGRRKPSVRVAYA